MNKWEIDMMRKLKGINSRIALVLALLLGMQFTQLVSAGQDKSTGHVPAKQAAIVYKPPLRGAPQVRVGSGSRGIGGEAVVLQVLAPDHIGLTTQAQPTIYWYARTPAVARFEFALIDDEGIDLLLEVDVGSERIAGFRQLDLGDHGVTLQPGVSYQWSVALVSDDASRSLDLISSGIIERIEPGEGLNGRISNATGSDLVGIYASEGIWYDALDTVSKLMEQSPADQGLVDIRDSLLAQVGLQSVSGR
jgi:hypothetical protein